jgi:hypothetical protein
MERKRDERLCRAQLARLLLDAIEKAEQLGEPDIAEIVRDALREREHPRNDLEDHVDGLERQNKIDNGSAEGSCNGPHRRIEAVLGGPGFK